MKRALKIIGIVIVVLVILLVAAPFLFKDTIEKQVKKAINENINAQVEWADLSLSLISSFPDARLKIEGLSVVNKAPFQGDTLVAAKTLYLDMGIPQLFKSGDKPLSINSLGIDDALVNIVVNKEGVANYDIAKESPETASQPEEEGGFSLDVEHYQITDSRINYLDQGSEMYLRLKDFNHEGTGDFSEETFTLHTQTSSLVSFAMDSVNYLDKNSIKLDADIKMDLKNMKFSFEENKALINQLPLTFDGYVKVNENNQELDITFKTPSSDFKNFLKLIPEAYSKSLEGVETTGNFSVDGRLYGVIDDQHIPKMKIVMASKNASFKYPDLPKSVENISLDAVLLDKTGLMEDLNLELNRLSFKIDQDVFTAHGAIKNLTGDMQVDLMANGTLNLANIDQAYPVDMDMDLDGILNADLTTSFAMSDIENEQYQNVKSRGTASISNFSYASEELANPVNISKAGISFAPGNIVLKQFDMTTGQTDAHLTGKLENLMGYLFKGQPIKGNFELTSNTFSVNDFMVSDTEEGEEADAQPQQDSLSSSEEAIKIPSFLDIALNFNADKVIYDNLTLSNAKGRLVIEDETAKLQNIKADIFGGSIGLEGSVATKDDTPEFDMSLKLNKINIVQSFSQMDLLKNFAPIAKALVGDLSTSIQLSGNLTEQLTPIYTSLAGQGLAQILDAKVQKGQLPLISNLNAKLDFINVDKLKLKDLTTHFTFKDGGINIEPYHFDINHDIGVKIGGRHTFDNQMDYAIKFTVPAKYLGNDVSGVLAKLSNAELENTEIEVPLEVMGSFAHPKIKVDLKGAVEKVANKIIEEQKQELKNKAEDKAKEKAGELLDNLFGGDEKKKNASSSDSTATEKTEKEKTEDAVKDAAKGLLDNLFGGKKEEKGKKEKKKESQ